MTVEDKDPWLDRHANGVIALVLIIIVSICILAFMDNVYWQKPIQYTVTVGSTETEKTAFLGTINSITELPDDVIKLKINTGTTFGIATTETFWINTLDLKDPDMVLLPMDIIKVTQIKHTGLDCVYLDSKGVEHDKPQRVVNIELTGDKCGIYYDYEVEKLK